MYPGVKRLNTNQGLKVKDDGDQAGFSLMELLIACGIFGILAATTVGVFSSMIFQKSRIDRLRGNSQLVSELKLVLSDRARCSKNLAGLALQPVVGDERAVAKIANFDKDGNEMETVAEVRQDASAITVSDLRLVTKGIIETDKLIADLIITPGNGAEAATVSNSEYRLPVGLTVQGGVVIECTSNVTPAKTDICQSIGATLDPKSGNCVPMKRTCHTGSSEKASCPAGAIPDMSWRTCACVSPPGFVDPLRKDRLYHDGRIVPSGPRPSVNRFDEASKSCNCVYGNDIDPAGWTAQICCLSAAD